MTAHRKGLEMSRTAVAAIIWAIAIFILFVFGLLIFLLDDAAILQEDWGWIAVAGGALFLIGDFYLIRFVLIRFVLMRNILAKQSNEIE